MPRLSILLPLTLILCLAPSSVLVAAPSQQGADDTFNEGQRQADLGTAVGFNNAIRDFKAAAQDFHALHEGKREGDALNRVGECCDAIGQTQKALQLFLRALPLRRGDNDGESITLNNIGVVYGQTGESGKALQFYRRALPFRKAAGDKEGEALTLTNIGAVYGETGQPEKALQFFQQALPLQKAVVSLIKVNGELITLNASGAIYEALTLHNLAAVYRETGQSDKALEFYQQALPLCRAGGDKMLEASVLDGIGVIYCEDTGQPDKAVQYYLQALPLQTAAGDKVGAASTLHNIGDACDAVGQINRALQYYQQALPLERAAGDRADEANTLHNIGLAYEGEGQPEKALEYYQQALPLERTAGDKIAEVATLKVAAESLHTLGRGAEARKDYEASLAAADAVIGSITQNELKRSTNESFQFLYQSYIQFLLQQDNRADDRRALEISEKARSRALRDLLAGNRSQLPSASLTPPAGSPTPNTPVLHSVAPSTSNAKTTRAVSEAVLRGCLATVALSMPDLPLTFTGQAEDFHADEAKLSTLDGPALVYHPLPGELAIFVVESSGAIHVARFPITPADLNTLTETAREEITSPDQFDPDETKATLRKLYDRLIKPVAPWLPTPTPGHLPTLTLVPFGSLLQLPFAALMAPDGQYLVQKYAIRTSPSLTVLRYTRQRAESLQKAVMTPLIFGDPVMPQGFAPLPGAMAEAKQVSAMLISNHPEMQVQDGASEANFRKLAPAATEIHLATHGYVDELQPRLSGVILSASSGPEPEYERDGYLTVEEVFHLKLNARLVTLSACDTGLGPAGADGVFGLQSAFLTAGAASLLSSLWEVSDTATAKLMAEFYHEMETDPSHNRAQALRGAQLSLLATPGYQQPEYWAAFQLTGEAR